MCNGRLSGQGYPTGTRGGQVGGTGGTASIADVRHQSPPGGASSLWWTATEGATWETAEGVHGRVLELWTGWTSRSELLPAPTPGSAGKLDTPGTVDQVSGGDDSEVHHTVDISPITGGYRLPGTLNGVEVTLLLDTGAAVTLVRQDVWSQLVTGPSTLKPWSGATLVSAGGTPLSVHGCARLGLGLGGRKFQVEFVVVSPLTSEAILGIDFLQAQQATIDLGRGNLLLRESGCDIKLNVPTPLQTPITEQKVCISSTVEVPPPCVMEVQAYVDRDAGGVWLVEEAVEKELEVAVARAIVEPKSAVLPVCVLNVSDQPVTLYAGAMVATMTPIDPPVGVDNIENAVASEVDGEKQQTLWQLAADSSTELTPGEIETFYHLLLTYADVLASSNSDLGRTNKLRHHIDTGNV